MSTAFEYAPWLFYLPASMKIKGYCTKKGRNNTFESDNIGDTILQATGLCGESSGPSFWGKGYNFISGHYDKIKLNTTKDIKNPFLMKCS